MSLTTCSVRCTKCLRTNWSFSPQNETYVCLECGLVITRQEALEGEQQMRLQAAIVQKVHASQPLGEWKRSRELLAGQPEPVRITVFPPGQPPTTPEWMYWIDEQKLVNKSFNPPPLPKAAPPIPDQCMCEGGPFSGEMQSSVVGAEKRWRLAWPEGAFYALELVDNAWVWSYYGSEDVP